MTDNRADKIDEIIDVYDSKGNLTGKKTSRGKARKQNEFNLVVTVFLANYDNKVVVEQRSFNKIGRPGQWEALVSGSVLSDEDSLTAAIREIKEELGLTVSVNRDDFFIRTTWRNTLVDYFVVRSDFKFEDIEFQVSEVEQVKLVDVEEMYQLLSKNNGIEPYQDMIPDFLERIKNA
ncbi:MAG: NUDIX domain-containing protein [Lactobacillaceae bacterium]|jgi:isopentenyldiphosphate isomerase|nr:NUDIX domain-containing protein [Lactobacillaceae bacterium]